MFCPKCGAQNPDNSNFCEKCGARITASATSNVAPTAQTPSFDEIAKKVTKTGADLYNRASKAVSQAVTSIPKPQTITSSKVQAPNFTASQTPYSMPAQIKKLYWITLALHVISFIFFFIPSLYAKAGYDDVIQMEESSSIFGMFSYEKPGFAVFLIIVLLASALLTALPMFTPNRKKPARLFLSKLIAIVETIWLLFCITIMSSTASNATYSYKKRGLEEITASAGLTFAGYIYLASLIALIIMLFKTTSKDRKLYRAKL